MEQFFYTEDDDETEEQIWKRKNQARDNPTHQLPDISFDKFSIHTGNHHTLSVHQKLSNTNTIAIEQNNDVILQLRLKILKEDYSETVLIQDTRHQQYARQLDRMSIQDDIITRQNFDETGNVKYNQILLPNKYYKRTAHISPRNGQPTPGQSKNVTRK